MFNCDVAAIDLTPMPLLSTNSATLSADSVATVSPLVDDSERSNAVHATDIAIAALPEWLLQINDDISRALERGVNIRQLVTARACVIDDLLIALFNWFELDKTDLALFATGGYGRGELSLYSDVDILLLTPNEITADSS